MSAEHTGPEKIRIHPSGPLGGYVNAPPSKNYTARIVLAAALARGRSIVVRPAGNDDALALVRCIKSLGARVEQVQDGLEITGVAGRPSNPGVLNPGNAGAVLRLLLGTACLAGGAVRFETDHPDSLGRRPNEDLLAALRQLGVRAEGMAPDGRLPIVVESVSGGVKGGAVSVSGARSSQFLSSLLFLAPFLDGPTTITVAEAMPGEQRLVSRPLIDQTIEVLRRFGAEIKCAEDGFRYEIAPTGLDAPTEPVQVNGDWPSSAALMSVVAVAGGMVALDGLLDDFQGERRAAEALAAMGCGFSRDQWGRRLIHSKGELHGIEFNGDLATDAVLALEAAACLAEGTTRFTGVGNLRIKESDRIREPLEQLARIGVKSRWGEDWIEIIGRPEGYEGGCEVDCRGDHRIAQLLAIVGTRCAQGLTLVGAGCVSKSHPGFFDDLRRMGVKLDAVE